MKEKQNLNPKIRFIAFLFLLMMTNVCVVIAKDVKLPSAAPGGAQFIKKYPSSDRNKDGVLTIKEKDDFCIQYAKSQLGENYIYEKKMVPMRDGVKLATAIFRPNDGGTHPVVLTRTAYGIHAAILFNNNRLLNKGVAFICQDLRGDGDSEGKGTFDARSFDNEINDGYDTIDWISKQSFCNGSIGIEGQSGHGFCGYMAYLAKHPKLKAISTNVSGGNAYLYWTFHNGVRREMYNWLFSRNIHIPQWPKPTIELFDQQIYQKTVQSAIHNNKTAFIAITGWYDIFAESALDYFQSFAENGNVYIRVDASGHGGMKGLNFPPKIVPEKWKLPNFTDTLHGKPIQSKQSTMVYYLMGDPYDPNAPGNEYKMTTVWPVPNTPTSYYLKSNGSLDKNKPNEVNASLSFKYDPRNPVPSHGGDVFIHQGVGAKDQRPLMNRKDILRFVSEPLTSPLEITGKVKAELFVSTDVEDTTFTAKLIDIYPNGYQAVVRDSIMMTRFYNGFDQQSKIERGKVYKLSMDLWSTALVVNKGHRLAVHISSSNTPKYEVHPNTFKPVNSFNESPIATNTVMMSSEYPSRIILPVVIE